MNITIIGLGVIGGSLGLAIRENNPHAIVTGFDDKKKTIAALQKGAIDFGARTMDSAVRDADIIFLCTPVYAILKILPAVAASCKKNAFVTDVGSTKNEIVQTAKKYFKSNGIFIGGHPMAGSEGKGIDHADTLLFQNATYVLCAGKNEKRRISPLTKIIRTIGARVLFLPAEDHDKIAAAISHFPQLMAVAMMNLVGKKNIQHQGYLQLAAGGFRDITRIASSPYEMWDDILASNSKEIQKTIREFSHMLSRFAKDLQSPSKRVEFARRFKSAKKLRDAIPKNSKGFLHPLYAVTVSVEDKPGVLSLITAALFKAKINIKDIELLKIRDGRGGTFRISFDTKRDAERATSILKQKKIKTL